MSTVQIAGIAVVVVILIVIVVSLIITRRKDDGGGRSREADPAETEDSGSLFDEAPRDQLHMLGKRDVAEQFEEPQPQPRWQPPTPAAAVQQVAPVAPADFAPPVAQAPEESAAEIVAGPDAESLAQAAPVVADAESAPSPPDAKAPVAADTTPVAAELQPGASSPALQDADSEPSPAAEEPAESLAAAPAEDVAEEDVPGESRMVRLSDIIVTTNEQQVDLADPDVRRMLKDLVQDEIDLAAQYRELGQNIDAVLQLTEARRICDALGMTSHARLIQQMINELQ